MKRINPALILTACATAFSAVGGEQLPAFVNKVVDGDTVYLSITGALKTVKVRLAGIDAPEKENRQSFALTAEARLEELIAKKNVSYELKDVEKYKRQIGFVYLDGKDIGLEMVREGMAWHYDYYLTNDVYKAAQEEAKANRRGLWIEDNPTFPAIFRKGRK